MDSSQRHAYEFKVRKLLLHKKTGVKKHRTFNFRFARFVLAPVAISLPFFSYAMKNQNSTYFGVGIAKAYDVYHYTAKQYNAPIIQDVHGVNTLGNVFAGLATVFKQSYYLAAELGTDFPGRKLSFYRPGLVDVSHTYRSLLSLEDFITGDLLPGFSLNSRNLLYARVGLSLTHVSRVEENLSINASSLNMHKNVMGQRLGAGWRYHFKSHIYIRGDYIFFNYPTISTSLSALNAQFKQKQYSQLIGLSLIYSMSQ